MLGEALVKVNVGHPSVGFEEMEVLVDISVAIERAAKSDAALLFRMQNAGLAPTTLEVLSMDHVQGT